MLETVDVLILSFKDFQTDENVPVICREGDLKRGYVTPKLFDEGRQRYYAIGQRPIEMCDEVSRFTTFPTVYTENMLKWEERNKLYEKYPTLKEKERYYRS